MVQGLHGAGQPDVSQPVQVVTPGVRGVEPGAGQLPVPEVQLGVQLGAVPASVVHEAYPVPAVESVSATRHAPVAGFGVALSADEGSRVLRIEEPVVLR